MTPTLDNLFDAILEARQRVYALASPTPLERLADPGPGELFLKREDLSPIHAYKWRGAYNRMRQLTDAERGRGVVCASAGNHAQGVALSARALGTRAAIFMPRSTPRMKQEAVAALGGEAVEPRLEGDSYDAASAAARAYAGREGRVYIHPYDDMAVMAGQGTLADEIVMSGQGPFDRAYLQIGGGGMAAAVACWLKRFYPKIEIVGVEGVDQASMAAAVRAGEPVTLDYLDVFCDGTAVKRAGDLTSRFCAQLVDRFVTATNEEVCAGIQLLWDRHRIIPEPAGALGVAAWMKEGAGERPGRSLAVVGGANMDFGQLSWVARHAGIGSARRKFYRFFIEERPGSLLDLLERFLGEVNIVEFQHGMTAAPRAAPVIGVDAMPATLEELEGKLRAEGVAFEDATGDEDVEFRLIRYDATLLRHPCFARVEFPERAGALRDFLLQRCQRASIALFSYSYTGERVGRALMGFDFESEEARATFRKTALVPGAGVRHVREIPPEAARRLV